MNDSVKAAIAALLECDESVTSSERRAVLAAISGNGTQNREPDRLLVNQQEAARLLGVSRFTIHRMVKDGDLHPVEIRGAKRYRVDELAAMACVSDGMNVQG